VDHKGKETIAAYNKYIKLSKGLNKHLAHDLARHQHLLSGSREERVAFYLLAAVRIRNGSHHKLDTDEIQATDLVIYLLTAALITYHHVVWPSAAELLR
jgi:hypothetical protein